jgi:hypothetical protein
MPKTYDPEYLLEDLEVPDYLLHLVLQTPTLLPGERRDDYFVLFEAMIGELLPELDLEWLLVIDLAWIFWEIQRYRRWKNAIIVLSKRPALEEALLRTDPHRAIMEPLSLARAKIRMKADEVNGDWKKDRDVAAQLAQYDYNDDALNAAAFLQSVPSFGAIEKSLASARKQLTTTMREAIVRREFKLRTDRLQRHLWAEERELKAKKDEKKGKQRELAAAPEK